MSEVYVNKVLPDIVVYPTQELIQLNAINRMSNRTAPNYNFMRAVDIPLRRDRLKMTNWDWCESHHKWECSPYNCINTATSAIIPTGLSIARNTNLYLNPEKYHFKRIPAKYSLPGDLIQFKWNGLTIPNHAGVVTRFDDLGNVWGISSEGAVTMHPEKNWGFFTNGGTVDNKGDIYDPKGEYFYYRFVPEFLGNYIQNKSGKLERVDDYLNKGGLPLSGIYVGNRAVLNITK